MTNFFDQTPSAPFVPPAEPWPDEPPLPSSEDDYGAGGKVVTLKGEPVALQPKAPALWHSDDEWDEADIPVRPWLVPGYIMRGAVSLIAGAGSSGKSSLLKAWAIACALGVPFHRFRPCQPLRVMTYNVEDDLHEERRRFSATLRLFEVGGRRAEPHDLTGMVRIIGPASIGTLVHRDAVSGFTTATDAMAALEAMIAEYKPDAVFLDPLVELHTAEENDNTGLRSVVAYFRSLAVRHQIGVVIAHHTRKGAVTPGDPDAVRGAGAIVGAARVVHTVCGMTEDEAAKCGLKPERRRFYFRLDSAKSNYAPVDEAEWFERRPFVLDNGEEVAAAAPWSPPSPWDGVGWDQIGAIMEQIEAGPAPGEFYAPVRQAKARWVGTVVAEMTGKTPDQAAFIVRQWIAEGVLETGSYMSPSRRHEQACVRVNGAKVSEMRHNNGSVE